VKIFHKIQTDLIQDSSKYILESDSLSETEYKTVINKSDYYFSVQTSLVRVTSDVQEDEFIHSIIKEFENQTEEKFKEVIGCLANQVDAKFEVVRNQSCPINNFVADICRIYMNTDCCIINSGSLRIDSIINEGDLTYFFILFIKIWSP
jgi:2',3'-cyclic-nucleotide 2'-phosphodiesterase (5'-nucleotidase family)